MPAILRPARRQVNAQDLLREVHAAEDGLEAGVVTHLRAYVAGVDASAGTGVSTARVADELVDARLKKGKTYRDLYWGAPAAKPDSSSGGN